MKKFHLFLVSFLLISTVVSAANKYWVGPMNGNWNNPANWSLTKGGAGGAAVPDFTDKVEIASAMIKMDASPTIHSLFASNGRIVLYTSNPCTLTIVNNLGIGLFSTLKDSTATNVPFDVYFKAGATGSIAGTWIFEGNSPLSGPGNPGASFIAPAGSLVTVVAVPSWYAGGSIVCGKNSKPIISTSATLKFENLTSFIADNLLDVTIPFASWAETAEYNQSTLFAATIRLYGNLQHITYAGGVHNYGSMEIDLRFLTNDVSLALPNGSKIRGNLTITNTNNRTLTLLDTGIASSLVQVEIGNTFQGYSAAGYVSISGSATKVSLAKATASTASTTYKLMISRNFSQSGGNFSLQDYNNATGESTLAIRGNLSQTGGTFFTNSTSVHPSAKFRVIMDDPIFQQGKFGQYSVYRSINMSGGTIDNGRNMVTLRINHTFYNIPGYQTTPNGVLLESPLIVGRLELVGSPLTTTNVNILTVTDPSPGAITVSGNTSYINGPLRRATNSTQAYCFPTGIGNIASKHISDSCIIVPVSNTASLYQAKYDTIVPVSTTIYQTGMSATECWNIGRITGADAQVKLILNGPVIVRKLYPSSGIQVGYSSISPVLWVSAAGSVLSPASASTGSVISKPMSTFGYFTFMHVAQLIPIKPLSANSPTGSDLVGSAKLINENENNKLSIAGSKIAEGLSIYPNPFVDNFTVDFYNPGNNTDKASVDIYDVKGRLLYTQQLNNLVTGHNRVLINPAGKNLPEAVYVARLNVNGVTNATVKLMKKKS